PHPNGKAKGRIIALWQPLFCTLLMARWIWGAEGMVALAPGVRERRDRLAWTVRSETETARLGLACAKPYIHRDERGISDAMIDNDRIDNDCAKLDEVEFATDLDDFMVSVEAEIRQSVY